AFDIEGLGGEFIQLLHEAGLVKEPADIFALKDHREAFHDVLRRHFESISQRNAEKRGKSAAAAKKSKERTEYALGNKLLAAIDARRTVALDRFILALGIPDVGESTAKLLARNFHSLDAFLHAMKGDQAVAELDAIEGIGDVTAQTIKDFFDEKHTREAI